MIYDISLSLNRKTTYTINGFISTYNRLNKAFVYYSQDKPLFASYFTCPNANFPDFSQGLCIPHTVAQANVTMNGTINATNSTNPMNSTNITINSTNITIQNPNITIQNPTVPNDTIPLNLNIPGIIGLQSVASIYNYENYIGTTITDSF